MGMPKAWQDGYKWAGNLNGPSCEEAMEALGYDFGEAECKLFLAGAECGQDELGEGIYNAA